MKKHFGMLVFALVSILPACGSADRDTSLTTLSSSLRCATDDDCASGWACRAQSEGSYCESKTPPPSNPPASECSYDSDCPSGEECEHEHGLSYCKPHGGNEHEDYGKGDVDAGTRPDSGMPACSGDDSYGHATCYDDHGGGHDEATKYDDSQDDDSKYGDDEDRSGPNRGHH